MNHIDNFSAPVVHKPSHDRIHLCLEIPIQKTRHINESKPH